MSKVDILNIGGKLIIFRRMYSFDYLEFIKFSKEKICKKMFIKKYIEEPNTLVKIGLKLTEDEIMLIVIYKNSKIKKLIYDHNYDFEKLMKKIYI